MPKRGFGSSALIVVIVVMIFAVVIFAVTPMMFVPTAVLSPVMAPIIVLVPIAVVVAPPITVMIATLVSIPIMVAAAAWAAIARCGTPRSAAARRYVAVRSARWNPVMLIDILHSAFHAADFTLVVGGLVVLPSGVIAVKPLLIA